MITVAPTGAELDKSAVPLLPVTLDELVTTAKECREAGAAMVEVPEPAPMCEPAQCLPRP